MELDLVVWINEIKTTVEGHQTYLMGQPLEQFDGTAGGLDAQQFVHMAGGSPALRNMKA